MIYDTLNNLPNYLGVSDNLDTVIEYIMARDITTLPAGRTRIDGEKAVVTVSTVTPQSSDKALFQRHDAHIVLETDLEGSELFEVSLAELTPTKPPTPLWAPPAPASPACCARAVLPCIWPGSPTNPA
jgi:biofilm protein TabA